MTITYRKYRTAFGAEFEAEDRVHHFSNLREVKDHARANGASTIIIIDSYASVQRPKRRVLEVTA